MPDESEIDTSVPQTARVWNYWLGGADNYPVDRALGDQIAQAFPVIVQIATLSTVMSENPRRIFGLARIRSQSSKGSRWQE